MIAFLIFITFLGNKYINVFETFNNVVTSCFGQNLDPHYQSIIGEFFNQIQALNISITPKIHAVVYHVPQFIKMKGKPLGLYSEQASESVHFAYSKHASNFKTSAIKTNYEAKLLRTVCTFNTLRQ